MCDKYSGWANYQTWNVSLWLNNDEGSNETCLEFARNGHDETDPESHVADALKEFVECYNPLTDETSVFSDILTNAMGKVDWYEIARGFLEDVADEFVVTECAECGAEVENDDFTNDEGDAICEECGGNNYGR